jgi:hypothetical protein
MNQGEATEPSKEAQTPQTNLYVGNLSPLATLKDVENMFSQFGKIARCKIGASRSTSKNGYAFVQFEEEDSAKKAVDAMNGAVVDGRTLRVNLASVNGARKPGAPRPRTNVYLSNLPLQYTTADLVRLTEKFGKIIGSVFLRILLQVLVEATGLCALILKIMHHVQLLLLLESFLYVAKNPCW